MIDYNRLAENAVARDCSPEVFQNGLLHSVVRHLILYMPYEASFYSSVQTIDVRVLQGENKDVVLYASMPLEEAKAITSKFRVFMNSFSSPRAGFCFTVDPSVLETWVSTLIARRGVLGYDNTILQATIAQAKAITEISIPALESLAASPEVATQIAPIAETPKVETPVADAPVVEEPIAEEPVVEEPIADPATPAVSTPSGFDVLPYLSKERVLTFDQGQWILQPDTDYAAIIETTQGNMTLDLFEVQAPNMVNNFVFLARNQYYDGVSFFRVIDDFMAQAGDPTGTGLGSPGYQFADEIVSDFSHSTKGVLSMARCWPNTNGAQFFITLEATPWLDGSYSIFGAVIEGLDVLDSLQRLNPDAPLAVAPIDSSLGLLETQGITLEGNDRETLEAFLTRILTKIPEPNQRFAVGGYDLVLMTDPQSNQVMSVFYPASDIIKQVYILQASKVVYNL